MINNIRQTIQEKINPILELHKGSCEALDFSDGVLKLTLSGGCVGCPSSMMTLFNLVVPILQENHPEIQDILLE